MYSPEIAKKPNPDQLFKLAAFGVTLAKDQDKHKESRKKENAHFFLPQEIESVEINDEDYFKQVSRFTGRVARTGYKQWSMKLVEQFWVCKEGAEDGFRKTYRFKWTPSQVTESKCSINVRDLNDVFELGFPYDTDVVDGDELQADLANALNMMQHVSESDCGRLISDLQDFCNTSRLLLQYNR